MLLTSTEYVLTNDAVEQFPRFLRETVKKDRLSSLKWLTLHLTHQKFLDFWGYNIATDRGLYALPSPSAYLMSCLDLNFLHVYLDPIESCDVRWLRGGCSYTVTAMLHQAARPFLFCTKELMFKDVVKRLSSETITNEHQTHRILGSLEDNRITYQRRAHMAFSDLVDIPESCVGTPAPGEVVLEYAPDQKLPPPCLYHTVRRSVFQQTTYSPEKTCEFSTLSIPVQSSWSTTATTIGKVWSTGASTGFRHQSTLFHMLG